MTDSLAYPAFADLPAPLRPAILKLLAAFIRADADPLDVLDDFTTLMHEGSEALRRVLSEADHARVVEWFAVVGDEELVDVIQELVAAAPKGGRSYRPATPDQFRIIREAQGEVGLDFAPFFEQLTSWQADALIKGILVVSEVQRLTGDRHFAPRDLRRAIRDYVQKSRLTPH